MKKDTMPIEESSRTLSFRDLMARPDATELVRLFHLDTQHQGSLEALVELMDKYDDTVLAVQDHIQSVAQHIAKEGGRLTLGRSYESALTVSALLLVAASARISDCSTTLQNAATNPSDMPRITFKSVRGIVFNLDGSPQEGITVVIETEDPLSDQLLCTRTNSSGRLPVTFELPDGKYMMTMLYSDRVERQPIYIGQPKGEKPKGSVRKLA